MNKYFAIAVLGMSVMISACSSAQKAESNAVAATTEIQQAVDNVPSSVTVNFAFDSAALTKKYYAAVKMFVKNINQDGITVNVDGYTDDIGTEAYNMKLSMQRAEAVADYLEDNGVDRNNIVTRGHGKNDFVADNETEEGRAKNRRVEVTLSSK